MKVCTDACLLGALADFQQPTKILDIGAGTGLLSFMMAQKYPQANVWASEIEAGALAQLAINQLANPTFDRIQVIPGAIQKISKQTPKFDGIICNPPFYTDHLASPNHARTQAHHQNTLTIKELVHIIDLHLHENGIAWILLPPQEMSPFLGLAHQQGLRPIRRVATAHSPDHPISREYVALQRTDASPAKRDFFSIYTTDGQYDPIFRELLQDFYIIF